jgi:hypothetical protein
MFPREKCGFEIMDNKNRWNFAGEQSVENGLVTKKIVFQTIMRQLQNGKFQDLSIISLGRY